MLAYSLRDELRALSTVYDALSTVFDVEVWTSETVDKFIERFLHLALFAELQPLLTVCFAGAFSWYKLSVLMFVGICFRGR